jgi:hypothetical protein
MMKADDIASEVAMQIRKFILSCQAKYALVSMSYVYRTPGVNGLRTLFNM